MAEVYIDSEGGVHLSAYDRDRENERIKVARLKPVNSAHRSDPEREAYEQNLDHTLNIVQQLDAANKRIKELEAAPADVLAVALIPPNLKARILEAFRVNTFDEFPTATMILEKVLDGLGIK